MGVRLTTSSSVIQGNFIGGVAVDSPKVRIRGNRIFDNLYLGIDLRNGRVINAAFPNYPPEFVPSISIRTTALVAWSGGFVFAEAPGCV